jgi:peptidoglycan/LPS O-acetylase OafA/YrhL
MPQEQPARKPETFPALNGLRFFAALAVVIFHYAPRADGYARVPEIIKNLIGEGPSAVGFFFILSGFVLAHRHLRGTAPAQNAKDSYWARFARLYPAYLLAFLLFLPVALQRFVLNPSAGSTGHHTFVASGILSLLMLQSWTPFAQAWNGPGWSLSVEAFMYLMFPLIGFRLAKLTRSRAMLVLTVAWLISSGLAIAYVARWIPEGVWRAYITNNPLLWLPLFIMGVCASRFVPSWKAVAERNARVLSTCALLAVVLAALVWPHQWADILVTGGIAPLLVALIVCFTRTSNWISRAMGGRLLRKLGEVSYVIYILQAPLWRYWQPVTDYLRRAPLPANAVPPWEVIAFVPFLILVSLAVQRFVEVPVRSMLSGWRKMAIFGPAAGTFRGTGQTTVALAESD